MFKNQLQPKSTYKILQLEQINGQNHTYNEDCQNDCKFNMGKFNFKISGNCISVYPLKRNRNEFASEVQRFLLGLAFPRP